MKISLKKQPNSSTCESSESSETFLDCREFGADKARKVSQVKIENSESSETKEKVSQVSLLASDSCETHCTFYKEFRYINSKFHKFHQFQWGIVGGVFL